MQKLIPEKLNLISEFFAREQLDFVCLQETMVSDKDSQNDLSKKWNGPSFWSLAIGRRGGVVILGSPRTHGNISVWQKDAGGHLVSLLITYENVSINLVNIYAPTYPREKEDLFPITRPFLFS